MHACLHDIREERRGQRIGERKRRNEITDTENTH
jgi:hypothetical protein